MISPFTKIYIRYKTVHQAIFVAYDCILVLFLLLLCTFALSMEAAAHNLPNAPGQIVGRVVDDTGAALVGVDVALFAGRDREPLQETTSGTDGLFRFDLLSAGLYKLGAGIEDNRVLRAYYGNAERLSQAAEIVVMSNQIDVDTIVLNRAGTITGQIQAGTEISATINYIEALKCTVDDSDHRTCSSSRSTSLVNPDGVYTLTKLLPGEYIVCADFQIEKWVDEEECWNDKVVDEHQSAELISVSVGEHVANIDFVFAASADYGQVRGQVMDTAGVPIEGIEVFDDNFRAAPATTDTSGMYTLSVLRPGPLRLRFVDQTENHRYIPQYYGGALAWTDALTVTAESGQTITGIDATMELGGRIQGRLTITEDLKPDSATVKARRWQPATSDFDFSQTREVIIDTGEFEFAGLPDGTYELSADAYLNGERFESIDSNTKRIAIANGSVVADIDFTMMEQIFEGEIHGTVTNQEGRPLANIRVTVYNPSSRLVYVDTDSTGTYRIAGLNHGSYRLHFSDPTEAYAAIYYPNKPSISSASNIEITAQAMMHDADVMLAAPSRVTGVIRDSLGNVFSQLRVRIFYYSGDWQIVGRYDQFETNSLGRYTIDGLAAGTYRICIVDQVSYRFPPQCIGGTNVDDAQDIFVGSATTTIQDWILSSPRNEANELLYLPMVMR